MEFVSTKENIKIIQVSTKENFKIKINMNYGIGWNKLTPKSNEIKHNELDICCDLLVAIWSPL